MDRGRARESAHFLSTLAGTASGPVALLGFRARSVRRTVAWWKWTVASVFAVRWRTCGKGPDCSAKSSSRLHFWAKYFLMTLALSWLFGAFHAIGVNQDWDGAVPVMPSNSFNHAPPLSVLQAARPEPLLDMVEMSGFGSC